MNQNRKNMHIFTQSSPISAIFLVILGFILYACQPVSTNTQFTETAVPLATSTKLAGSQAASTPMPAATKTFRPMTPTVTVPVELQVQPEELKGIEVSFWYPWSGNTATQINTIVNEFNQVNIWGIQVNANSSGSASILNEEVENNLITGQAADVVVAPIDQIVAWQSAAQVVIPLDHYLKSPQWGMQGQEIEDIIPLFLNQDRYKDNQMAIPALRDGQVLFYNSTWALEMGFPTPPTSPAQFRAQSCAALQANVRTQMAEKIGTGGWIIETNPLSLLSWMEVFGGQPIPSDDSLPYSFNSTANQDSINYLLEMFTKTCIWPRRLPNSYDYFSKRMALFYSGSVSDIPIQARQGAFLKSKDQWTVIPYPSIKNQPVFIVNGPSYAILRSNPKQQLAAWLFIRWLALPRNQVKLVETTGLLPVNSSSVDLLKTYASSNPQWKDAVNLIPLARSGPVLRSWSIASIVLQDAGWQFFHQPPTPIPVPTILQQIDDTIPQLMGHRLTPTATK